MRGILAFIAGLTSVLLAAPPGPLVTDALAQQETATVIGTVRDSQQAALPGATVTVKNVDTGFTRTGTVRRSRALSASPPFRPAPTN